jgi:uncharacterized phage-associated protein
MLKVSILRFIKKPLFAETIEAWTYGPVIPVLYHHYKENGSYGIRASENFDPLSIDRGTRTFLDEVYKVFGQFSAVRLMNLTHSDRCWIEAGVGNEITWEAMRNDLKKYLKNG